MLIILEKSVTFAVKIAKKSLLACSHAPLGFSRWGPHIDTHVGHHYNLLLANCFLIQKKENFVVIHSVSLSQTVRRTVLFF
jgi:hypothetical protein